MNRIGRRIAGFILFTATQCVFATALFPQQTPIEINAEEKANSPDQSSDSISPSEQSPESTESDSAAVDSIEGRGSHRRTPHDIESVSEDEIPQVQNEIDFSALDPKDVDSIQCPYVNPQRESELKRADKKQIQEMLGFFGFYSSTIDGDFGKISRRAIGGFQSHNEFEITCTLSVEQHDKLLADYNFYLNKIGLEVFEDLSTGISLVIPKNLLETVDYEPPFTTYRFGDEQGLEIVLVGLDGDRKLLGPLYEVMKSKGIVPHSDDSKPKGSEIKLSTKENETNIHAVIHHSSGKIMGFVAKWGTNSEEMVQRLLPQIESSLKALDRVASDEINESGPIRIDPLAELDTVNPKSVASGFAINRTGAVITSAKLIAECERIVSGNGVDLEIKVMDADLDVAILIPKTPIEVQDFVKFKNEYSAIGSRVAVSGFSFGGLLSNSTLTFGSVQRNKGLLGEDHIKVARLPALDGDVGGPVLDNSGAVVGVLRSNSGIEFELPDDIRLVTNGSKIADFIRSQEIEFVIAPGGDDRTDLHPVDLVRVASEFTEHLNCY